jgi:RimJ/RimL family protein N-acetyltransferase
VDLVLYVRPVSSHTRRVDFPNLELVGPFVHLTPVDRVSLSELTAAMLSAPEIWQHIPFCMATEDDITGVVGRAIEAQRNGRSIMFATRLREGGEIIGGTSLFAIDDLLPSVEIGFTWIVPRWQRTRVNTEAKLLQLGHCFEVLRCERVELKTDVLNLRSRAAIARIGATQEGVLRAQRRRLDGSLRDSVLFSIIASEWPTVRAALQQRAALGGDRAASEQSA